MGFVWGVLLLSSHPFLNKLCMMESCPLTVIGFDRWAGPSRYGISGPRGRPSGVPRDASLVCRLGHVGGNGWLPRLINYSYWSCDIGGVPRN